MKLINKNYSEKRAVSHSPNRKTSSIKSEELDEIELLKLALARKNGKTIKIKLSDL